MNAPRKYAAPKTDAWLLFRASPILHVASAREDGTPLLRTFHAAPYENGLVIHAGAEGEKLEMLGRPVVVSVERIVARVPSYFVDPAIACPATTYYESAMARGTLLTIDDPRKKAAALQSFMQRHQAEGGYTPIAAEHPTYGSVLRRLVVAKIEISEMTAKRKLGQNRSRKQIERIAEQLWMRGAPGDLAAIEPILDAHPDGPRPPFLEAGGGMRLCPAPRAEDLPRVLELLRGQYWTLGESDERLAEAHENATAWVGLRAPDGRLVGSARANTDGTRHAYVADVVIDPELRGRGLGRSLVRFLLGHPRMRRVARTRLSTKDRSEFYGFLGFQADSDTQLRMVRVAETI